MIKENQKVYVGLNFETEEVFVGCCNENVNINQALWRSLAKRKIVKDGNWIAIDYEDFVGVIDDDCIDLEDYVKYVGLELGTNLKKQMKLINSHSSLQFYYVLGIAGSISKRWGNKYEK